MTTTHNLDPDVRRAHEDDERRERLVEHARQLDAELSVLTIYDDQRSQLGHDFGNGQRAHELIRVRRERDLAVSQAHAYGYGMGLGDLAATPRQIRFAYARISRQRLARYKRDSHRARTAELALTAWRITADEIAAIATLPPEVEEEVRRVLRSEIRRRRRAALDR